MRPSPFPESNQVLKAPEGYENCGDLAVYSDGEYCISHWKLTWKERLKVLFGRSIWLYVWYGRNQPPVALTLEHPWAQRKR